MEEQTTQNKNNDGNENDENLFNLETSNPQNEMLFVGALYKNPDLYIEFDKFVRPKYYFTDKMASFFYVHGKTLYGRNEPLTEEKMFLYMSENERYKEIYNSYGGYTAIVPWKDEAIVDNAKIYFDILQKYALVREYQKKGFNVSKLINSSKFNIATAREFFNAVKRTVDNIHTRITGDSEVEILNKDVNKLINGYLDRPSMGMLTPFPTFNDIFRGLRKGTAMGVGMTSNSGKTRFMIKMLAYLALVEKQRCMVMVNEMSIEDIKLALLTTCCNNPEFQKLHRVSCTKKEKDLALGIYRDKNNRIIERDRAEDSGEFEESVSDYIDRLSKESDEYNNIKKIAEWIEKESEGKIFALDMSTAYLDSDLETAIKKIHTTQDVDYFFYDTLKNELSTIGEWASLKQTTTKLAELARELDVFIYASLQLTDDVNNIDPLDLNSMNIAASKGLKTVLSSLTLWKEIDPERYERYAYKSTSQIGDLTDQLLPIIKTNNPSDRYYSCVVDKNRAGQKKKLLFSVNLDTNVWIEMGDLYRK